MMITFFQKVFAFCVIFWLIILSVVSLFPAPNVLDRYWDSLYGVNTLSITTNIDKILPKTSKVFRSESSSLTRKTDSLIK